ncbi:GNAT family N-acetyltransferase [Micromonospora sp. NPDC049044]|uniref:GNAT family N-acetyltransferase n=1 Tax=unclassified Micromonospora TaxID=2617518 RepID=UPI0034010B56
MDDTAGGVRIRRAGPADATAVLDMLDSAVVWMNDRGNTEQWGTRPFSEIPARAEQVDRYLTEHLPFVTEVGGTPAAALVLGSGPDPRAPITPAEEPELFVRLLVTNRRFAGRKLGSALLAHAVAETRRAGVRLLRVDCWAGGGGELVAYYERHGFTPTETFLAGTWPGQVLAQRVG